jgi:hypothetical protein
MAVARTGSSLALVFGLALVASPARAQEPPFRYPTRDDSDITFGMAEVGIGLLTLPTAEVCVERTEAGCSRGDRSLMLSAWPLFRRGAFAGGAGVTIGLTPRRTRRATIRPGSVATIAAPTSRSRQPAGTISSCPRPSTGGSGSRAVSSSSTTRSPLRRVERKPRSSGLPVSPFSPKATAWAQPGGSVFRSPIIGSLAGT